MVRLTRHERNTIRNKEIVEDFKGGKTTIEIANDRGMTRQNVQIILKNNGLSKKDGGNSQSQAGCN